MHISNGNISNSTIDILHWNKGPSALCNTIPRIRDLVGLYKPHVIMLNEFNLRWEDDLSMVQIPGYTLKIDTLRQSRQTTKVGMFFRRDVYYKRRKQDKVFRIPIITAEIGLPNMKIVISRHFIIRRRLGMTLPPSILTNN